MSIHRTQCACRLLEFSRNKGYNAVLWRNVASVVGTSTWYPIVKSTLLTFEDKEINLEAEIVYMLYNSDNGQVPWILKTTWWRPSWSRDDKSRGFIILLITQLWPFFTKAGLFIAALLLQMLLLKLFQFDHLLKFLFTYLSFTQILFTGTYILVIYSNFVYKFVQCISI